MLVVLSVVGALTINLLVVLNLPPPTPDFYRMAEIAQVLKQGPGATTGDHRPLVTRLADQPPAVEAPTPPGSCAPPGKKALAGLLGVDPARLVITSGPVAVLRPARVPHGAQRADA